MNKVKQVFISQPMRGKTPEEIKTERERAIAALTEEFAKTGEQFEVIDSYQKDFKPEAAAGSNAYRIEFLAKSIQMLAKADVLLSIGDWTKFSGCVIETAVAVNYGIEHIVFYPAKLEWNQVTKGVLPENPK
jgi:hypothetical protein